MFLLSKIKSDPNFKGVYLMSLFRAYFFNNVNSRNLSFHICKEVFLLIPEVIYTEKHFYLLEHINDKIDDLKTSGLIEFWHSQSVRKVAVKKIIVNSPKVLNFNDFKGCFQIILCGSFASLIVFVVEILLKFKC